MTNAEYAAFVAEGGPEPWGWDRIPPDIRPPEWGDLPVIGVRFAHAQAYAHWAGKRLPSFAEWQKAARGADGWDFPWGPNGTRLAERSHLGVREHRALDLPSDLFAPVRNYLIGVARVGEHPQDRSPYGAYDMLGNVWEWTETPVQNGVIDWPGAWPLPRFALGHRIACGAKWTMGANPIESHLKLLTEASMQSTSIGFRCAKSDSAP